jgi:alkylhydroperoxidase/carboxymuconolactone decarboxylase family protein YurZ
MSTDNPVLDTLTDMTAASVDHNSLSVREFMISRLAAMVAVDAPPISYFVSASAIEESGLTAEDIQGVMIAVAPVTGAPRVMSAGGHILRALGIAVAIAESEMAAEDGQP